VARLAATAPVGAEGRPAAAARQARPAVPGQRPRRGGYAPPSQEAEAALPDGSNGARVTPDGQEEPESPQPLDEEPATAVPAAQRQTQKPRQGQQRRKPSGRQTSRSAKRRRR